MITEFFEDIIFRWEDVLNDFWFLPGDEADIRFSVKEPVVVFVVKLERNLEELGK